MDTAGRGVTGLLALTLLLLLSVACGGDASAVSLADLAAHEDRYEGDTVLVTGRVRPFTDEGQPPYYVLEDAASNRVMLLPAEAAAPHDGARHPGRCGQRRFCHGADAHELGNRASAPGRDGGDRFRPRARRAVSMGQPA